ncbi:MAG: CocE/NonD family hydrolase [Chitinophagaceae bacterium]|nr:MAG: CocE/NonD family hydrolase [Chitinophagaceae bacterium]
MKKFLKPLLTAALLAFVYLCPAQKIRIPSPLVSPDSGLTAQLAKLAPAALPLVKESDPADNYFYRSLYYIWSEQFPAALNELDSLALLRSKGGPDWFPIDGIDLRSYVLTRIGQSQANKPFNQLYADTITQLYNRAPSKSKPLAASFFDTDSSGHKERLAALIAQARGKDSLPIGDLNRLSLEYFNTIVSSVLSPIALKSFRREDEKIYIIQDSVLIDVAPGVKLAAVIVRKRSTTTPQPVIMRYNIYASNIDLATAQALAEKGYVGIILLTRGKYLSPNTIEPFQHDAQDVYQAIDWISKQPWCNGKIGMFGGSYLGFSQWSAVKRVHPALKTIVPQVAVGAGIDYPQTNGVFMSYMLRWIHMVTNTKLTDRAEFNSPRWDSLFQSWYTSGRPFRALDTLDARPNAIFQRWLNHPLYDSFWQKMVPYKNEFANLNIPVLTTTGYYDDDQRGAFYYMQEHLKRNKQARHYLLIGPWNHGGGQGFGNPVNGQLKVDSVAVFDVNTTVYQWFDHILKDSAMPVRLKDRVTFEISGANEWRSVPSLQATSNDSLRFYLGNVFSKNGYRLAASKPAKPGSILQEISYTDRSDARAAFDPDGPVLDTVLKTPDQLVFYSDTLATPVIMNGSMHGLLNITINKKDVDLHVRLYELTRDGKYYLLSRWWARASYIRNREKRTLLTPGKSESIPLDNAYYMCRKIATGSRLVATVGIVKTPNWQLNYGTGKDVSDETMADGKIPLLINWGNNSYITVPLLR